MIKKCKICGNEFNVERASITCSTVCSIKLKRKREASWKKANRNRHLEIESKWRIKNRNKIRKVSNRWYENHKEEEKKKRARVYKIRRNNIIQRYGGKCVCCGETNVKFLTLDHVNNDGYKLRKLLGTGKVQLGWIEHNNYPDTIQVLCYNCNCGRSQNCGVCPHKEEN
jgi:hypothetical protein